MGQIISAIGRGIMAVISAIANVIMAIVGGITTVLLAIWDCESYRFHDLLIPHLHSKFLGMGRPPHPAFPSRACLSPLPATIREEFTTSSR
ncbi:hypothetical protein TREMEDRAFT_33208 [Tremella mesenterica DSM 1558]|uniref:uncharacterized protein n=1 Tax=Tremella mesenterica (strain ATCC 24925 / CBS 8224 / DSM 1558 / NBRC 9311 / NRRL Y-6157 / RJB 2259-6 / UBC 559-6) TaxID=578456 RepID=UPI0003F49F63|nr:uncharacterized protein TREMEDRAFT_33208 [Tremella mesenterica DSM 1558]EIW67733.1 hypothetical protein TREMEDRAFT_33208 [Tremella mesenterica DSM 1558]